MMKHTALNTLTQEETIHYSRHLIMPEVGIEGQQKLKGSSVLLIGAGGLGSPVSQYLAAAGVGTIGIVEFDHVDKSNLHRQVLYSAKQVGQSKLACARSRLEALNPHIKVNEHPTRLSSDNALEIFQHYDVIVDGTDNFPTRYLVNDACVLLGKPNVYASIFRFEGQVSIFNYQNGPCYRCLYPEPPPAGLVPSCAEGGVLGVLPGIVGTLQANEVIKLLLNLGKPLSGELLTFDALSMSFNKFEVRRADDCSICSDNASIKTLIDYHSFCGHGVEEEHADIEELTAPQVQALLNGSEKVTLIDIRSEQEYQISHINGSIHIPLDNLKNEFQRLNPANKIVCQCYMGQRSLQAAKELKKMGFEDVASMKGGILSWNAEIDSTVLRY